MRTAKPKIIAMIPTTRSFVMPADCRTGSIRRETTGSPTHPNASEATVIPTWHTER